MPNLWDQFDENQLDKIYSRSPSDTRMEIAVERLRRDRVTFKSHPWSQHQGNLYSQFKYKK